MIDSAHHAAVTAVRIASGIAFAGVIVVWVFYQGYKGWE